MKKVVKTILSAACVAATVASLFVLTGCNKTPAVITPEDTVPTQAVEPSQMNLGAVMAINSTDLKWSRLSAFTHTINDDGTATFKVADDYGEEATLVVEFDEKKDTVSKADLSYDDLTVSILTDDNFALQPIMKAMYDKTHAE